MWERPSLSEKTKKSSGTMDHLFRQRRISVPKRTSELVALVAVSCTLFLFLHTRDLSTKLRRMEGRLNDDVTAFNHLTDRVPTDRTEQAFVSQDKADLEAIRKHTGAVRSKPQRTLEAEPEYAQPIEEDQEYIDELLVPEPWELNNTARAGAELLFFNRVPKVGSQTFMELLRRLAARNQFTFHQDVARRVENVRMSQVDQKQMANLVSMFPQPASYTKHVCHINFTRYGYPDPIYVNVVRDPIERVISWFYYVRAPWYFVERKKIFPDLPLPDSNWLRKDFETCVLTGDPECRYIQGDVRDGIGDHRRQTMFFCGHDPLCTPFNSVEAMQRAKAVVEQQYAVVGILEHLNSTLVAFEKYVPRFFDGASQIYWKNQKIFNRVNRNMYKPQVSEEVKQIVRANFTREIEFYEFCKQRLHMQLRALRDPTITLPTIRSARRRRARRHTRV